jgi:hypothetical protein
MITAQSCGNMHKLMQQRARAVLTDKRPISVQIDEFLARTGGTADPNALYTVWAGANDVFFNLGALQGGAIDAATLQTNVLAAAQAEIAQIRRLRDAGAQYIAVFGLPNIGLTPAFRGTPNSQSVTATAGNVIKWVPLPGAGLVGLLREKKRYLVINFDDPNVDVRGTVSFRVEDKETLDKVIPTIGTKAKLTQRGDAYYRPRTARSTI